MDKPIKARINLYGSFAKTSYGHCTERVILAGLLGMLLADERIREAEDIAERDGLQFEFVHSAAPKNILILLEVPDALYSQRFS